MGLLGESDGEGDEANNSGSSNGLLDLEQAVCNKYPLLIQRPGEIEDEERSKSLISEFKAGDTGDRITRWLLHKLQSSSLEVELLARFSEGLSLNADTEKWQEEVINFWFFDSANLPPSAYKVEPTRTLFTTSALVDLGKVAPTGFSDVYHI